MGIFSSGNQDDDARPKRGARTRSRNERTAASDRGRGRRAERPDADAMLLDPTLPEKQRARRRLVGAIAPVVAAIVILPMVLDSRPKPVTSDIAIDIPNPPASSAADSDSDSDQSDAALASSDTAAPQNPAPSAVQKPPPVPTAPPSPPAAARAAPQPAPNAQFAARSGGAAQASASNDTSNTAGTDAASEDGGDASSPASPPGARFAVQLGSFRDEATAQSWVTRLKKLGVPAYVEHRTQADGQTAVLLRAGPFADRAAAAEAVAKVRGAGLAQ